MSKHTILAALVAPALLLSPIILAQPAEGGGPVRPDVIRQADANADGKVTFDELSAARPGITREAFDRMDRNGDGVLSEADRPQRGPQQRRGGQFREKLLQADDDKNGQVTFEEAQAAVPGLTREAFDRLDTNGDGVITRADMPERPRRPGVPQAIASGRYQEMLRKADANGDNRVTYEEMVTAYPGFPRERFDRLDTNNDGVISSEDRLPREGAAPGAYRARRGPAAGQRDGRVRRIRQTGADGEGVISKEDVTQAQPPKEDLE